MISALHTARLGVTARLAYRATVHIIPIDSLPAFGATVCHFKAADLGASRISAFSTAADLFVAHRAIATLSGAGTIGAFIRAGRAVVSHRVTANTAGLATRTDAAEVATGIVVAAKSACLHRRVDSSVVVAGVAQYCIVVENLYSGH